jgi:hypothetical protein
MLKVSDLVPGVKRRLANRIDAEANAPYFLRDAIRELTDDFDFSELEVVGPQVQLTVNTPNYAVEFFQPQNNVELNRMTLLKLFTDPPNNSRSMMLKYREPALVLPLCDISGVPSNWTRYGGEIWIGCKPNTTYTVQAFFQKKHPFLGTTTDTIKASDFRLPDNWQEIIEIAAALKGAAELRLPDFIQMYHNLLHGDPKRPEEIGMLKRRVSQHEKDKVTNEGNISIRVERYTF